MIQSSINEKLIGTVTNTDSVVLNINLASLGSNIVTEATSIDYEQYTPEVSRNMNDGYTMRI